MVIVSSPTERAYLLGDVVQHPLQLNDNDLSFAADADAALATKTRRALLDQLEAQGGAAGMAHFPTGAFQRITGANPRIWQPTT